MHLTTMYNNSVACILSWIDSLRYQHYVLQAGQWVVPGTSGLLKIVNVGSYWVWRRCRSSPRMSHCTVNSGSKDLPFSGICTIRVGNKCCSFLLKWSKQRVSDSLASISRGTDKLDKFVQANASGSIQIGFLNDLVTLDLGQVDSIRIQCHT
jgi:hypothetical protein